MAVVVAESGIGKTRLVQALYQQLTTDPQWDPPEVDYWPDSFRDGGMSLRVVPDMAGHTPKGPPRFVWIGGRWSDPTQRNATSSNALLELHQSVMVHGEIIGRHGSVWGHAAKRLKKAVRTDGIGEAVSQAADAVLPLGGLIAKAVKGAIDLGRDRLDGPGTFEESDRERRKSTVETVLEGLSELMDGPRGLPTVMWLDDAQWMDAESLELVVQAWRKAQARNWRLLIVATHWEREWRESRRDRTGLAVLADDAGVEVRVLDPARSSDLLVCVRERLPGLTAAQCDLMIEKAGGNFLTLVENVAQLKRQPASFVGYDIAGPLSPVGERKANTWKSRRQERVQQRFEEELEPAVQDLLGWGSYLGESFLAEVVEQYARDMARNPAARELLSECVDPLSILGRPHELTREFRDQELRRRRHGDLARRGGRHHCARAKCDGAR